MSAHTFFKERNDGELTSYTIDGNAQDTSGVATVIPSCCCVPHNLTDFNTISISLAISATSDDCPDDTFTGTQTQVLTRVDRDFDLNLDPSDCGTFQLWTNCLQDIITTCVGINTTSPDDTPLTPGGLISGTVVGLGLSGVGVTLSTTIFVCAHTISPSDSVSAPETAAGLAGSTVTISGTTTVGGTSVNYTLNVTYSV